MSEKRAEQYAGFASAEWPVFRPPSCALRSPLTMLLQLATDGVDELRDQAAELFGHQGQIEIEVVRIDHATRSLAVGARE